MDNTEGDPVNPKYEETNIDEVEEIKEPDIAEETKIEQKPNASKSNGGESQKETGGSPTEEQGATATYYTENAENGAMESNKDTEANDGE